MSLLIYPRTAWTSTAPGFPRYSGRLITPARVTHLRLHYPGDGNHTRAHYTKAQSEQALRNYRAFHVGTRGWADIGYPYAIDQSGRIWVAAGHTHAAAHSATPTRPNENWHSLAFLLLIGNNETPSAAMIASVNALWAHLLGRFPNMRTVTAHRDVPGASTACAGPRVSALLRQGAFKPASAGGATTTPAAGPSARPDVEVQLALAVLDLYDPGPDLEYLDGDNGAHQRAAVQAYQRARGLLPDGWWGTNTNRYFEENDMSKILDEFEARVRRATPTITQIRQGQSLHAGKVHEAVIRELAPLNAKVDGLSEAVSQLAVSQGLDPEAITSAIEAGVNDALDRVRVVIAENETEEDPS